MDKLKKCNCEITQFEQGYKNEFSSAETLLNTKPQGNGDMIVSTICDSTMAG